MTLVDEKYIRLTTFKRDGTDVSTPVWVVPVDDRRVGFWTSSTSGEAERLKHNAEVVVQPSTRRGDPKPGTEPIRATAHVVTEGDDFDAVHRRIKAKYGAMASISKVAASVRAFVTRKPWPYADRVVLITLPDAAA